jgi:hypothetical protein
MCSHSNTRRYLVARERQCDRGAGVLADGQILSWWIVVGIGLLTG